MDARVFDRDRKVRNRGQREGDRKEEITCDREKKTEKKR